MTAAETNPVAFAPSASLRPFEPPRCHLPVRLALVLGCLLRLMMLDHKPLWEDEGWTFGVAIHEGNLVEKTALDPHPFSFYAIWSLLGKSIADSEWTFRLPSALLSCAALLMFAPCLARLRLQPDLQRWCVLLMAVLPLNIRYSHEARAYALAQCVGVAALLAFALARDRATFSRLVLLALAVGLSCHVDIFGLAIPAALLVHCAWTARRVPSGQRLLTAVLLGGLLAAPYNLWRASHLLGDGEMHALVPVETRTSYYIDRLVPISPIGITYASLPKAVRSPALMALLGAAVAATAFFGVFRPPRRWIPRDAANVLGLVAFIPAVGFLLIHVTSGAETLEARYFVTATVGFVPLFTVGWLRILGRVPLSGYAWTFALPLAVSLMWLQKPTSNSSSDWRAMHRLIAPQVLPGDGFLHEQFANYPRYTLGALRAYAWQNRTPIALADVLEYRSARVAPGGVVELGDPADWETPRENERVEQFVQGHRRVWTMSSDFSRERQLDLSPVARNAGDWYAPGLRAWLWIVDAAATAPAEKQRDPAEGRDSSLPGISAEEKD